LIFKKKLLSFIIKIEKVAEDNNYEIINKYCLIARYLPIGTGILTRSFFSSGKAKGESRI